MWSAQVIRGALLKSISLALFVIVLASNAALAQTEARDEALPNFHQVNEHLYRGAQPRAGGISRLKALGIKSILNLREVGDNTRDEEREARAAGLNYYSVPMDGMSKPTDEQISAALVVINAEANWPVFVHCKRGADRTGTIVAIYRIQHDNWTARAAIREAKQFGMSRFELGMKHYIEAYEKRRTESKISVLFMLKMPYSNEAAWRRSAG
jgi:protein tyrosine/serine phosphatase